MKIERLGALRGITILAELETVILKSQAKGEIIIAPIAIDAATFIICFFHIGAQIFQLSSKERRQDFLTLDERIKADTEKLRPFQKLRKSSTRDHAKAKLVYTAINSP